MSKLIPSIIISLLSAIVFIFILTMTVGSGFDALSSVYHRQAGLDIRRRNQIISLMKNEPSTTIIVSDVVSNEEYLVFILEVKTDCNFSFGGCLGELVQYQSGEWIPVPYIEGYQRFNGINTLLPGYGIFNYIAEWKYVYGLLKPGLYIYIRYLIPNDFACGVGVDDIPPFEYIFVEFEI